MILCVLNVTRFGRDYSLIIDDLRPSSSGLRGRSSDFGKLSFGIRACCNYLSVRFCYRCRSSFTRFDKGSDCRKRLLRVPNHLLHSCFGHMLVT